MRFRQDCLAATLYLVCSLLISQSNNMGDKFIGCISLIGPAWLAAVIGGCVVSKFDPRTLVSIGRYVGKADFLREGV